MSEVSIRYSAAGAGLDPGVLAGDAGNLVENLEALAYAESLDPIWVPRIRHEMRLKRAARDQRPLLAALYFFVPDAPLPPDPPLGGVGVGFGAPDPPDWLAG